MRDACVLPVAERFSQGGVTRPDERASQSDEHWFRHKKGDTQ